MRKLTRIQAAGLAVVMAVLVGGSFAIAQSGDSTETGKRKGRGEWRGQRMHRGGAGPARMFRQLDLTDAQKAQLGEIRQNHRQSLGPIRAEIRSKRQEIRQSSEGGAFDEAFAAQKLTEIAALEAKLMGEQHRIRQEMLSVLTPEQRQKMEQLREQFKTRRTERRARKQSTTL